MYQNINVNSIETFSASHAAAPFGYTPRDDAPASNLPTNELLVAGLFHVGFCCFGALRRREAAVGWIGVIVVAAIGVFLLVVWAEFLLVAALFIVGGQAIDWLKTGVWHPHTIASQFTITAASDYTGWVIVDKAINYAVFDLEIAIPIVLLSAMGTAIKEKIVNSGPAARPTKKADHRATRQPDCRPGG
ncbi:hypothetical protein [Rhodopseudomonas faecalis]|uniref:hypothetical protein n=1 Tax=Rhodopseudomonas faecalis TaxID=99655 RepID=UPI000DA187EF|nr:hypothetical protein [Rhodopseudomonas faecalis]